MLILAKVTLLWNYQQNASLKVLQCCGNMCFRLLCVLSAVQSVTESHSARHSIHTSGGSLADTCSEKG
jgi:hypothetical protein